MNVFFNVTENDRIETIEKRVDATKLPNDTIIVERADSILECKLENLRGM